MVSVDATEGVTMEATKGGILCVKFSNAEDMANYRATCIDKENGKNMTVQADKVIKVEIDVGESQDVTVQSCEGDTLEYIKPGKQGIAKIDTLKSTGKVKVKAKGNATVVIKATPVKKARYCLVGWYAIINILQGLGAIAATITACMYEFTNSIAPIQKSFNCSITDNIDYWAELDTVQCYYTSIALNDVFIIFYGIMSGCVVTVATFGFF